MFSKYLFVVIVILNMVVLYGSPIDPRCPLNEDEDSIVVLIPHESDCSKFYACDHGQLSVIDCQPGLLFNPDFKVCDWPQNVKCDKNAA